MANQGASRVGEGDLHCVVATVNCGPVSLRRDLEAVREGGIHSFFVTVAALEDTAQAMLLLSQWRRTLADPSLPARLCTSVSELQRAKAESVAGVVFHFQGTEPLHGSVDLLEPFANLGLRVLQLTYNYRTHAGDGCFEPEDAGLSLYGRRLVDEACRRRIALDITHAGTRTSLDILERSALPVLATHANARALCDSPRNLTDEVIKAAAASGGVIGLCAFRAFVAADPEPTIDDLVRHAAHIAELVGPQHVGLGWDFAESSEEDFEFWGYDERYYPRPPWTWPHGLQSVADTGNIVPALSRAGFSATEIAGVMGGNFLRALTTIWGA